MTREEMREKVARALAETQGEIVNDAWRFYLDDADAAVAIIRGETLEEAARVAMASPADYGSPRSYCEGRSAAAAAIRNLRSQHDPR